ncbi:hypothetical protein B0H19DRAFT_1271049 [Mycena capillaripes]|nr:hypothetical protein B0H19DRAFT_1271049 [Mycena capillaripes]
MLRHLRHLFTPPPASSSPAREAALQTFATAVANATAAVQQQNVLPPHLVASATPAAAPSATVSAPQFPASRPMANAPKGHPLATAGKTQMNAKPKARGRPKKAAVVDVDAGAAATDSVPETQKRSRGRPPKVPRAEEGVPGTGAGSMSAEARAETARINREAAELRKVGAEMRKRGKEVEEKAAAADVEAKRRQAALQNPAGEHDLFVTGSRPKRALLATKNPDGTDMIRPKKRSRADVAREEDQRILDGFAKQKGKATSSAPPKK